MAELPHFTTKDFDKGIAKGNWVVDFWAGWCGPCKMLAPVFAEAAGSVKNAKFGKVDIVAERDLAEKFEVLSIPTMLFFKDGKLADRIIGLVSKEEIAKKASQTFK